jgi:hypothetical protein
MKRLLVTILALSGAIALIFYGHSFIMYGIAGWQLGTWVNQISEKFGE